MDQETYEVRLANWTSIVTACQSRPEDQTAREWLALNNVPEKQYYYWLRKIRKTVYAEHSAAPAPAEPQLPSVSNPQQLSLAEIPIDDVMPAESKPAVVIRTKKSTIEISSGTSETLVVKILKAVNHAL